MSIILAHRGASGYVPENTLEAFRLGMDMGADGFELDVHMSKDGQLVVIHDGKSAAEGTPSELCDLSIIQEIFGVRMGRIENDRFYCQYGK